MPYQDWGNTVTKINRLAALGAGISLCCSGPALAASQAQAAPVHSSWAALSAFASVGSSQALCGTAVVGAASTAAATAATTATQPGAAPGCVFPAVDAPPPPVVDAGPLSTPAAASAGGGIGLLPLLLGLAALAGVAALLLADGDNDSDEVSISPR